MRTENVNHTVRPKSRLLVSLLLFVTCLPAIAPRLVHPVTHMFLEDFNVYYTAALMARGHQGVLLYEGADTGVDPQMREAPENGVVMKTARSAGIPHLQLYVYPPTLADLLIPISLFSRPVAGRLWDGVNFIAITLAVLCIADLAGLVLLSWQTAVLWLAVYILAPVQASLAWGQVTLLLFVLWTGGAWLFRRGFVNVSSVAFALAAALKLSPVLIVLPFLFWKDWRWLRAFLVSIVFIVAAICVINTPASLEDYFLHVMPAMSKGFPAIGNMSFTSLTELIWAVLHGVFDSSKPLQHAQPGAQPVAKLVNLLASMLALALLFVLRKTSRQESRVMTLLLLAPISIITSPVSWGFAFTVVLPLLALLWVSVLRLQKSWVYSVVLALCTSILMTTFLPKVLDLLSHIPHAPQALPILIPLSVLISSIALVCMGYRSAQRGAPEIPALPTDTPRSFDSSAIG